MNAKPKKITASIGLFIFSILLIFIGFLAYTSITDYQPKKIEKLDIDQKFADSLLVDEVLSLMTWNIGYAGLGKEMDFFYEGGKMVRPDKKQFEIYFNGITDFLLKNDSIDFFLLQEIDVHSKRTYYRNERKIITDTLKKYCSVFAKNYDVAYVPVPFWEPMGKVKTGMLTLSEIMPAEANRYSFPNIASWPGRLFLLDRCFIKSRYEIEEINKELVIINTHNSAYVFDDSLRNIELEIIKKEMMKEYEKGNFVIAGGDWNMNPPGMKIKKLRDANQFKPSVVVMNKNCFPDGWEIAFDPEYPTNRDISEVYQKSSTPTTIIDYFILSPNIKLLEVKTLALDFTYSDHQPVIIRVKLLLK